MVGRIGVYAAYTDFGPRVLTPFLIDKGWFTEYKYRI